MHVWVLIFREERIVALDPTAFHVLVPTCLDVSFDQGSLTLSWCVEFDLLDLILKAKSQFGHITGNSDHFGRTQKWMTYLATLRELLLVFTLEEVGPAPLPLHNTARFACSLAQVLAGQFDLSILTLWHVNGTEQRLNDGPTARSISQPWAQEIEILDVNCLRK